MLKIIAYIRFVVINGLTSCFIVKLNINIKAYYCINTSLNYNFNTKL